MGRNIVVSFDESSTITLLLWNSPSKSVKKSLNEKGLFLSLRELFEHFTTAVAE